MHACLPDLGLIRFAQTENHELFELEGIPLYLNLLVCFALYTMFSFFSLRAQEISLKNCEVEHDFSGGLSKRVIVKLSMIFLEASTRG